MPVEKGQVLRRVRARGALFAFATFVRHGSNRAGEMPEFLNLVGGPGRRFELAEFDREGVQVGADDRGTRQHAFHQHGAGTGEGIKDSPAWGNESFDEATGRHRMHSCRVRVKPVDVGSVPIVAQRLHELLLVASVFRRGI
jgi:hypothetical protein